MKLMATQLSDLPYISFLTAYPYPAFILNAKKQYGQGAATLNPIFGNPAFRSLLFGPDEETAELGYAFLKALDTVDRSQKLAYWLENGKRNAKERQETLILEVKPSWTPLDASPVSLELTQTVIDEHIICTSTPRSPLPKYDERRSSTPGPNNRIGRDFNMRLSDLPPMPQPVNPAIPGTMPMSLATAPRSSSSCGPSSRSPERNIEATAQSYGQEMKGMIESFNWHLTPLGPRHLWDPLLKATLSFILACPYPVSCA